MPLTRVRDDEKATRPASRDRVPKRVREDDFGSTSLPLAVQIAARPWQEHVALAAMLWRELIPRSVQ
jgi:fatty acid amide hydrolase